MIVPKKKVSSSKCSCSGSMLVFGGVTFIASLLQKSVRIHLQTGPGGGELMQKKTSERMPIRGYGRIDLISWPKFEVICLPNFSWQIFGNRPGYTRTAPFKFAGGV